VPVLPVSLIRRAAYTRIFRESLLLEELRGKQVSNLDSAIENARNYAQSVVTMLSERAG
jgi:chromosome partitioning protein